MIFSRSDESKMHYADPLTAGIILRLENVENRLGLNPLVTNSKEDIRNLRKELLEAQHMIQLFVQAASFFKEKYKSI